MVRKQLTKLLLLAITVNCAWTSTDAQVTINATNFPDEGFRAYISENCDTDGNGVLSNSEIAENTTMILAGSSVADLTGISYFTNLKSLTCANSNITSLDLSNNPLVSYLDLDKSKLTSINVTQCTELAKFHCKNNQLTSLDLSNNTKLSELYCSDNQLTSLDVSNITELFYLNCSGNELTELVTSNKNSKFKSLVCDNNKLTSFVATGLSALTHVYLGENQLVTLDVSDCPNLKELECYDNQLTTLDVSNNTKLTYLHCGSNNIASIDLSENTLLEDLRCSSNQLSAIDLSNNLALTRLMVKHNNISSIDVSMLTNLQRLGISENPITSLDVTQNTALQSLEIYLTDINAIDLSQNANLTYLWASDCNLSSIDLSNNPLLELVQLYGNQLTELDFTNNTALTQVECYNNKIDRNAMSVLIESLPTYNESTGVLKAATTDTGDNNELLQEHVDAAAAKGWTATAVNAEPIAIDENNFPDARFRSWVSSNCDTDSNGYLSAAETAAVTSMSLPGNSIASLKGVEFFTNLQKLYCYSNKLTELDLSKLTKLEELNCYNNLLTSLDVSNNSVLTEIICHTNQIKQEAMDAFFESLPTVTSGRIQLSNPNSTSEGNEYKIQNVMMANDKGWTVMSFSDGSWTAISVSVAIDETNFPDANFRAWVSEYVDADSDGYLSKDEITAATNISVVGLNIASLKGIEYFVYMTILECCDNQLTSLDVSQNKKLSRLDFTNNQLTSIDLSNNTALTQLYCAQNQLTALDLSNNPSVKAIYCYDNKILQDAMDVFIESLPTLTSGTLRLYEMDTDSEGGNEYSSLNILTATSKGWKVYGHNGSNFVIIPVTVPVNATYFPDANFRAWVSSNVDTDSNGYLNADEVNAVTTMDVSSLEIADLTGIEYFVELTSLECYENQLTALDVSNNKKLTYLHCGSNNIASIDMSENTLLEDLRCSSNQLSAIDLSNNLALTRLMVKNNNISSIDVSMLTNLQRLGISENPITSLDVTHNAALSSLEIYLTDINAIDLSQNANLTYLWASDCNLTSIDLSNNPLLELVQLNGNQLTELDFTNNTALTQVECYNNQIGEAAMTALIASLPERPNNDGVLKATKYSLDTEQNVLTVEQANSALSKGWTATQVMVALTDGVDYDRSLAGTAAKMTYTRTFKSSQVGKYQSWYVPFDYTITADDNATFYKVIEIAPSAQPGVVEGSTDKVYVFIKKLEVGDTLSGNRPYIILPNAEETHVFSQLNTQMLLPVISSRLMLATADYVYNFYGTYDGYVPTEAYEFLSMSGGNICWNDENSINKTALRSYRWYIKVTDNEGNSGYAKDLFEIIEGDPDTTGLDSVVVDEQDVEGIYNTNGMKMESLSRGVNIVKFADGTVKKIYVK